MPDTTPPHLRYQNPVPSGARGTTRAGYLFDALRTRPAGRRALSLASIVLFLAGLGLFAYPFFSDVYAQQLVQQPLADRFESPEIRERYTSRTIGTGDPLTRLVIPSLGVDTVVVEGTSPAALRAGAGHYPTTPLPGEPGNVAIAGHRTTYGKPFNRLDEVAVGESVVLVTPLAVHTYRVTAAPADVPRPCPNGACWITSPTDWGVVGPTEDAILTLTTCHPKGSARERLILRAELVDTQERLPDDDPAPPPMGTAPSPSSSPQPPATELDPAVRPSPGA